MKKKLELRLPRLAQNWITLTGAVLATVSGLTLLVLFTLVASFEQTANPYFGIFLYLLGPPVLILGLALVPFGMWRTWRHWKKGGEKALPGWPIIDLNRRHHRNAMALFIAGTVIFGLISVAGTYGTYHYSESVTFCGTTCHTVMEPEYVTYQDSPHARVSCAECHVGPGADWFVKSKLSGTYQIYAVLRDIYPRPIPTPIESLRPAQQTCEQCHWPNKIYGAQQKRNVHYLYDEANTEWPIDLLIKTGGGDPVTGQTSGIHWHMNIGVEVDYVARDEKRLDIPWVRVRDPATGRVTVYEDQTSPLTPEELAAAELRRMDCMDCHNRPSHIFDSPDEAIDKMLLRGRIPKSIPSIKRVAVEVMAEEYESSEEALREIANRVTSHYRKDEPEFYRAHAPVVEQAIVAVQDAYSRNIFPEMNARWSVYTNNIGHFDNVGCMRCHNGDHVSEDGVVLTRSCNACHAILSQGSGDVFQMASTSEGLEFLHPEDIGGLELEVGCFECHSGVQP